MLIILPVIYHRLKKNSNCLNYCEVYSRDHYLMPLNLDLNLGYLFGGHQILLNKFWNKYDHPVMIVNICHIYLIGK